MAIKKVVEILLHILFPNKCMICRSPIAYDGRICDTCFKTAPFIDNENCLLCNHSDCICNIKRNHFERLISSFYYEPNFNQAIIDFKFRNVKINGKKLAFYMALNIAYLDIDLIIPAPLYKKDQHVRGFNQSYVLAKWVSFYSKIPLASDVLIKHKQTDKQHDLSAIKRRKNLKDAFKICNPQLVKGKTILLVDDVYTTGSTMRECSRMLKINGAKSIICLTAAKTKPKTHTQSKTDDYFFPKA